MIGAGNEIVPCHGWLRSMMVRPRASILTQLNGDDGRSEPKTAGHSASICVETSGDVLNRAAVNSGVSMVPREPYGAEQDDGQDLAGEAPDWVWVRSTCWPHTFREVRTPRSWQVDSSFAHSWV